MLIYSRKLLLPQQWRREQQYWVPWSWGITFISITLIWRNQLFEHGVYIGQSNNTNKKKTNAPTFICSYKTI